MNDCLLFIEPTGRRYNSIRMVCTCGESHGAAFFRNEEEALASGLFHPAGVALWLTDPRVGATARIYAKRFDAVAKAQAAIERS